MSTKTDYFALLDVAGVNAVVSDRIYPDVLPEDCTYPAIVYSYRSEPILSISGVKLGENVELPTSCWGNTRAQADQAADAVETALSGSNFFVTGREDAYDPETGLMATLLTVTI